jgi:hypothetical protein
MRELAELLARAGHSARVPRSTGWQSSAMIANYKRMARTFAEPDLGPLSPLDEAIPELREAPEEPAANDESPRGWARGGPDFEARIGFEPTCDGFANRCLTTWLPRR